MNNQLFKNNTHVETTSGEDTATAISTPSLNGDQKTLSESESPSNIEDHAKFEFAFVTPVDFLDDQDPESFISLPPPGMATRMIAVMVENDFPPFLLAERPQAVFPRGCLHAAGLRAFSTQ